MGRKPSIVLSLTALALSATGVAAAQAAGQPAHDHRTPATAPAATPIRHLVVIFQENVSFDHYFGTYPHAANPSGEPAFHASSDTPTVNGLLGDGLLQHNPNESNPQRLDRSQAVTCDQDHDYSAEQNAFDHGLMDAFVPNTGNSENVAQCTGKATGVMPNYAVMDYYDGNTVTGLWNYAQHFALSDNSFGTTFGPSTPGALNVTAGNTYGVLCAPSADAINSTPCTDTPGQVSGDPGAIAPHGTGTDTGDADPNYDVCSTTQDKKTPAQTMQMGGQNIGTLLDSAHVTWGWFQGGFSSPNYVPGDPGTFDSTAVCTGTHTDLAGATVEDYSPHHEPFQYYRSTANPDHLPPTSVAMIGHQDQANHQYDLRDFWAAADSDNLPSVSYLKAPAYEDGHAGYSDPLDEQRFLVQTINHLESLPSWRSTAVVIAYDDSDGWYDHQMGPIVTQSQSPLDTLSDPGQCGANPAQVPTTGTGTPEQGRCGVGPRLPLLVISPFARRNDVDNTFTDQTSIVRFIEDNWLGRQRIGNGDADAMAGSLDGMFSFGRPLDRRLFLDPASGEPLSGHRHS